MSWLFAFFRLPISEKKILFFQVSNPKSALIPQAQNPLIKTTCGFSGIPF